MPKIAYKVIDFRPKSLDVIDKANAIIDSYARQGFDLTLRQLYYQFVSRDWIPNKQTEYDKLGETINNARLAGLVDWNAITDRTRNVAGGDGDDTDPAEVIQPYYFNAALWEGQAERVEVWVEKDALIGIVGQAAGGLRVPYFSCRGYTSSSEVWRAAQRIEGYLDDEAVETVTILHLGDHDPSGIDMTRDIDERLALFLEGDGYDVSQLTINRIALNMDQVRTYSPPPNPAKISDSRSDAYIRRYGSSSWELDALEPAVLRDLIQANVRRVIDADKWAARLKFERQGQATLSAVKDHYEDVIAYLDEHGWLPEVEVSPDDEAQPIESDDDE